VDYKLFVKTAARVAAVLSSGDYTPTILGYPASESVRMFAEAPPITASAGFFSAEVGAAGRNR
jgi:hypothetical protein